MAAQEVPKLDTLPPAVKESMSNKGKSISERSIRIMDFSSIISPTGEADYVKYIQTLPGVATGSDGSSSYYVRGGSMGGNLQTLDGVPIYGTSHLIGLTTCYPSDIISNALFQVGGFNSEEGNFISSHIQLHSKDGSFDKSSIKTNISNAFLSAFTSTPLIKNRLSLSAAVRISPAILEYRFLTELADSSRISIKNANAVVYDIYAKLKYLLDSERSITVSLFHSMDSYDFKMKSSSEDMMNWDNAMAFVQYNAPWRGNGSFTATVSFNHYGNSQGMIKQMNLTTNDLLVRSIFDETAIQTCFNTTKLNANIKYGLNLRLARFNPGSACVLRTSGVFPKANSPLVNNIEWNTTATIHGQAELGDSEHRIFRLAGRLNYNSSVRFVPEISALIRMRLLRHIGLEATADYVSQFYHRLEGIPLGWSLDMMIAPSEQFKPETSKQLYSGVFFDKGKHYISAGAYYKKYDNLVYFSDATKLFNSSLAGWTNEIETGTGSSRGCELLYKKDGVFANFQLAYTWSKTDRLFMNLNSGKPFPAKYDRTHVFNANLSFKIVSDTKNNISISTQYTYQSGHWETVPAGTWFDDNYITGPVELEFYSSTNNYRMPPYIRCDLCAVWDILRYKYPQTLTIGVFNMFNRHNPFCLSYDPQSDKWEQVSLLPIMPCFKYEIEF